MPRMGCRVDRAPVRVARTPARPQSYPQLWKRHCSRRLGLPRCGGEGSRPDRTGGEGRRGHARAVRHVGAAHRCTWVRDRTPLRWGDPDLRTAERPARGTGRIGIVASCSDGMQQLSTTGVPTVPNPRRTHDSTPSCAGRTTGAVGRQDGRRPTRRTSTADVDEPFDRRAARSVDSTGRPRTPDHRCGTPDLYACPRLRAACPSHRRLPEGERNHEAHLPTQEPSP